MKELIFMMDSENFMIQGTFEDGEIFFNSLGSHDNSFDLEEIENIKDGFIFMFIEDNNICDALIEYIKTNYDTILEKINSNPKNKLMFKIPYDENIIV
ncbi:MAG: hypothetical protein ACRCX2_15155 [Paraclostridium sp.]